MESHQLYGVRETVPEFAYQTYASNNRLVRRTYEGHVRIIAAFAKEPEAKKYADEVAREKCARYRDGYMQIHEYEYRCATLARFDVVPVDVLPSVPVSSS